jgi:hypothetical protein
MKAPEKLQDRPAMAGRDARVVKKIPHLQSDALVSGIDMGFIS